MPETTAIEKPKHAPIVTAETDKAADLLRIAVERGANVDELEKLVALHERMQDRFAERDFNKALAEFQSECPPVAKKQTAKVATKSGGSWTYQYADLAAISRTAAPILHRLGFSYGWDAEIDGSVVKSVCTLRHDNGHSITASFSAPIDTAAVTSPAQKAASALTYAKRQSLIEVLGLTTCDPDDDGAGGSPSAEKISEDAVRSLNDMMIQAGYESKDAARRFLAWLGVDNLYDLTTAQLDKAYAALEKKIADNRK